MVSAEYSPVITCAVAIYISTHIIDEKLEIPAWQRRESVIIQWAFSHF